MLIDAASRHRMISFLDDSAGYNRLMPKEDISKTTFICLGFVGLFEWLVMTFGFGLKLPLLNIKEL